jgi:uncharacterized membrane protein SpoIIM required for sporulation
MGTPSSFANALRWYTLAAALSATLGMATSLIEAPTLSLDGVHQPPPRLALFVRVLSNNARILALMCVGIASFGVVGLITLVGNSFRFGFDLVSFARHAPTELPFLIPHAALEFAAYTVAGAACHHLGRCAYGLLVRKQAPREAWAGVRGLTWAAGILVLAAALETLVASARVTG